ncbi:MAG: hypothetical protein QNJ30_25835 [Kiloniellales bacterium]|nr:hypothetical protein [Kiloniellales bacterium]
MSRNLFVGCLVLVGTVAAGVTVLNMSGEGELATQAAKPAAINAQKATVVEPEDGETGPLEKAGRVADDLIEKAGLNTGDVEEITEKAKELGEKAAEKAEVVVEKVKETATRAIVKAEELADDGKDAAIDAAEGLGDKINTGK